MNNQNDEIVKLQEKKSRFRKIVILTLAFVLAGLAWFLYWLFYLQYHAFTDDAYASGNKVNINSAIEGSVIAFYADDTAFVEEGTLLIQLDSTEYQASYDKELAALAAVALEVKVLYDRVPVAYARLQSQKAVFEKAKYDYENRRLLIDSKAISNEDLIHSQDEVKVAEANYNQAKHEWKAALDAAGPTIPDQHPRIKEQKERVRVAYYQLQHTAIYAPATGHIAQRTVEVGQWVKPGLNLMAIIPTDYVWVDANFKETQLKYMRVGQPATIWFDMYGSGVIYKGKVLGIASGSGSVFSIIPPQNATGNWIKIVQRLPVRISLDSETVKNYPTRLGISAEVDVDITDQNLPLMTLAKPSTQPLAHTNVFQLDFQEMNGLMDEIVNSNLKN